MDRWKAEMGRVREKRRVEERRSEKRKSQKKEAQDRERVGKSRKTGFSNDLWLRSPEGRKVGSLKRRVRSQLARLEIKNCTPLWREAHFEVKMYKAHQVRITFGSWDVENVHSVVARSTFASEKGKSTSRSEHFSKLRCRKKCTPLWREVSKSKYTKHHMFGPLLEVALLKKCAPLWRKAHFEVKMWKTQGFRPPLEVQMSFRVAGARDCAPVQIPKNSTAKFVFTIYANSLKHINPSLPLIIKTSDST